MEYFRAYVVTNFVLVCISAIMVFIALHNYGQHKKMSTCIIAITALTLILSVEDNLQLYSKATSNILMTEILSYIGYTLKPLVLVWFIRFANGEPRGKWKYLFYVPLIVCAIIYIFAFIPATQSYVFFFNLDGDGNGIHFGGGPLRFTSHVVSAFYLAYFLIVSIKTLRLKHIANANILIICSLLIIVTVIIETVFDDDNDVHILNTAIMVCVMFYYLFLHMESVKYDPLTGLYNRATYYQDLAKMDKSVTAIIQLDMDALKYFNDNFGHEEGDKALKTIATAIFDACDRDMYPYRLSGDEFLIIVNYLPKEIVESKIVQIKADLRRTKYSCSIGYAYRSNKNITVEELLKLSEKQMYLAKEEFYKNSTYERRKTPHQL